MWKRRKIQIRILLIKSTSGERWQTKASYSVEYDLDYSPSICNRKFEYQSDVAKNNPTDELDDIDKGDEWLDDKRIVWGENVVNRSQKNILKSMKTKKSSSQINGKN